MKHYKSLLTRLILILLCPFATNIFANLSITLDKNNTGLFTTLNIESDIPALEIGGFKATTKYKCILEADDDFETSIQFITKYDHQHLDRENIFIFLTRILKQTEADNSKLVISVNPNFQGGNITLNCLVLSDEDIQNYSTQQSTRKKPKEIPHIGTAKEYLRSLQKRINQSDRVKMKKAQKSFSDWITKNQGVNLEVIEDSGDKGLQSLVTTVKLELANHLIIRLETFKNAFSEDITDKEKRKLENEFEQWKLQYKKNYFVQHHPKIMSLIKEISEGITGTSVQEKEKGHNKNKSKTRKLNDSTSQYFDDSDIKRMHAQRRNLLLNMESYIAYIKDEVKRYQNRVDDLERDYPDECRKEVVTQQEKDALIRKVARDAMKGNKAEAHLENFFTEKEASVSFIYSERVRSLEHVEKYLRTLEDLKKKVESFKVDEQDSLEQRTNKARSYLEEIAGLFLTDYKEHLINSNFLLIKANPTLNIFSAKGKPPSDPFLAKFSDSLAELNVKPKDANSDWLESHLKNRDAGRETDNQILHFYGNGLLSILSILEPSSLTSENKTMLARSVSMHPIIERLRNGINTYHRGCDDDGACYGVHYKKN